jgi:hypothetical protein
VRVSVVGICGSGKSSLVWRLCRAGVEAREVGQEHSYVRDLWRRFHPPDVLVFLDASLETILVRRPGSLLSEVLYADMVERLAYARACAQLTIATDNLTEEGVAGMVLAYLTCHYGEGIITPT